jgi:hypothetical protein
LLAERSGGRDEAEGCVVTSGGQVDLEHVATFEVEHEAQLARAHLEGAGIAARVLERGRAQGQDWSSSRGPDTR